MSKQSLLSKAARCIAKAVSRADLSTDLAALCDAVIISCIGPGEFKIDFVAKEIAVQPDKTGEQQDLLGWLFEKWCDGATAGPLSQETVASFIKDARRQLRENPPVALDAKTQGYGLVLQDGRIVAMVSDSELRPATGRDNFAGRATGAVISVAPQE